MPFITLTDTNDTPVWVRTETISTIGRHRDRTLVNSCAVRELPEQILALIADAESGGAGVEVTDDMVHEAMAVWDSAKSFAKARDIMRDALAAALKARRP